MCECFIGCMNINEVIGNHPHSWTNFIHTYKNLCLIDPRWAKRGKTPPWSFDWYSVVQLPHREFHPYHSILLPNAHIIVMACSKGANLEVQLLSLCPPQLLGSPLARVPAVKRFEKPICNFSLGCWESSACTLTGEQSCCFFHTGPGSDYLFCSGMKGFIALGKQWILGTTVEKFCHSSSAFLGRNFEFVLYLKPLFILKNECIFCLEVLNILGVRTRQHFFFINPVWETYYPAYIFNVVMFRLKLNNFRLESVSVTQL